MPKGSLVVQLGRPEALDLLGDVAAEAGHLDSFDTTEYVGSDAHSLLNRLHPASLARWDAFSHPASQGSANWDERVSDWDSLLVHDSFVRMGLTDGDDERADESYTEECVENP